MAELYNNVVCVSANELIRLYTDRGSKTGFLTYDQFRYKTAQRKLTMVRQHGRGQSALIEFATMEEEVKRQYISIYGDPTELVERSQESVLQRTMKFNEAAYSYFAAMKDENGRKLPADKVDLYTLQARVLDAVIELSDAKRNEIGGGRTKLDVWQRLSDLVNDLALVKDSRGGLRYVHKLPKTPRTLQRKCKEYEKSGWESLVHKGRGNMSAAKVKDEKMTAVLHKLLSLHMNLSNAQVMEKYNEVAELTGMEMLRSPETIERYRRSMASTTLAHRRGATKMRNTMEMQVKREAPTTAFTYWTLDGWTVELLYQKKSEVARRVGGLTKQQTLTTYHNRKTMVVVLDACTKYPIGYAIGDHESTALIREALREAVRHGKELFGERYKPLQLQSDNYQRKAMTPFYEAMTKYYTPAAVHNAKAKIIEPYFNYLNRTYCQLCENWSGFNVTASPENQPNLEILNRNHKCLPDEAGVVAQIHAMMAKERAAKIEAYRAAFAGTPQERLIPFGDEEYLRLMGETSGRTNRLTGSGLTIEVGGERLNYESFDMSLRDHWNEDWIVRYDPMDMSRVLISNATSSKGARAKEEIGTLMYVMEQTMRIPMALADQREEHFEYRRRVREFNESFEARYMEKQVEVDEILSELRSEVPEIGRGGLLERALIVDSMGQHKDNRTAERLAGSGLQTEDDDWEWNPEDMNFSRK